MGGLPSLGPLNSGRLLMEPMEINRAQFVYADFMIDVFVYTAVLNLFAGFIRP